MTRTRIFTVHAPPEPWPRIEETVFVKEGFAWPAFLLTAIWAAWHRLWLAAAIFLAGGLAIALAAIALELPEALEYALHGGWLLWIGFSANDWRRRKLARRGYAFADVVAAPDAIEAEHRYFSRHHDRTLALAP
ncbi:MAG TPA: DUF2628 domain-containing protein [Alphaproteobacteria bacterium]|jgi:hypothetical protein|nr:DUF2628 domain-containing protein [Alphaproteobacteria bacterium]